VKKKRNIVVGFAVTGFLIGVALGVFGFTPAAHTGQYNWLFVLLCPPFIGAMVDPKTKFEVVVVLLTICCANAVLYAILGRFFQKAVDEDRNSN
jgi:Na+/melibiose symporter-like transporter